MNTKDIRNALKARLAGMVGRPDTAWPNVSFDAGTTPRLEVAFTAIERQGGTLKGGDTLTETGTMAVIVVTEQGAGEDAGADLADAVAALFPEGQAIAITGGALRITAPASIRGGFPDEKTYRTPVMIRYRADKTT